MCAKHCELAIVVLLVLAGAALAADQTIATNTVWSGTVTVDGTVTVVSTGSLTIQPGTVVNFLTGGSINLNSCGAFSAQGTAEAPIHFNGSQSGVITGSPTSANLSNCVVSGLAPLSGSSRARWLDVFSRSSDFNMTNCTVSNSGQMNVGSPYTATISGCDIRDTTNLWLNSYSGHTNVLNSKITNTYLWTASKYASVAHNTMVDVELCSNGIGQSASNYVINDNYLHGTVGGFGGTTPLIVGTSGIITNNVVRGGAYNTENVGGTITGNVLEAYTAAERAQRGGDPTHENICGATDGSVIERNIMLNTPYCSLLGIGNTLLRNCLVANNTIDQRNGGAPCIYLNHFPSGAKPSGLVLRNNLLMRSGRMYDEQNYLTGGYADTVSYVDYNAWGGMVRDDRNPTSPRFMGVQITGKAEGDDGFGMHDLLMPEGSAFNPAGLVANADFVDPYSDADMLAGTYTTAQLLALYRQAYTPVAGSALINAGSPADSSDPSAVYGRIDIGAVEAPLLTGDANTDRTTDFKDYVILERNFGASGATWAMGDFNGDSHVDFKDYVLLEQSFGKSVPEPGVLALLTCGAFAAIRRRARHVKRG